MVTITCSCFPVTEDEIKHGLLTADNPSNTTLCYERDLHGLTDDRKNIKVAKFIDLTENQEPDSEAQELLSELRTRKVPASLGEDRLVSYTVPWKQRPLEESTDIDHVTYLEEFADRSVPT